MKLNGIFSNRFKPFPALLLVICWLVSGCSGSNVPVVTDPPASINSPSSGVANSDSNENIELGENIEAGENIELEMLPEDNSNPDLANSQVPNTVPVTFEITVPYYLSNELRVELTWSDSVDEISLDAEWVSGQSWLATGEFPTQGEHLLTITFYDKNGAVGLARYTQVYEVGSTFADTVYISADQFDANHFDSDGDGINNLTELSAQAAPSMEENSQLEIKDFYALNDAGSQYSRISVSQIIEPTVKPERPYVDAFETECCEYFDNGHTFRTLYGKHDINIDADGNGTVEVNIDEPRRAFLPTLSATRINSGGAVSWTSEYKIYDGDYGFSESITNTVAVLDESFRSFAQEVTGRNSGTFQFSWQTSANLTGKLIEGTSWCEPVSGTFTETRMNNYDNSDLATNTVITTVSKESDDLYWKVVTERNGSETAEYFARKLQILFDPDDEGSAYFTCDFVDF